VAAVAVWVVYASVYALTFALFGDSITMAIRGALANALPDGLLALAAFNASRAIDATNPPLSRLFQHHAPRAIVMIALAAVGKAMLLWVDQVLIMRTRFELNPGIIPWHALLSALTYVCVAASSHAWLIGRRLREEEANAVRADALRARAELAALRAQLNPHFLFNTLHSVLGLVRRDPALAETALEKLGDLLRYATRVHRSGVDWVTLRDELDFVDTYLDLETIRLGSRLQVERQFAPQALERVVPTFSLQPLVENAVRHGIAGRAEGGQIVIEARLEPDSRSLRLEVRNDTGGRTPADADEGGLGLRVLRDRLEALYRGQASFTAGPAADGGYHAVLVLPGIEAQE
jgi:hypothetical protein